VQCENIHALQRQDRELGAEDNKTQRHGQTIGLNCFGTFKMRKIDKDTRQRETKHK